jgi:hypothetical protein
LISPAAAGRKGERQSFILPLPGTLTHIPLQPSTIYFSYNSS